MSKAQSTEQERSELLRIGQGRVLEMIATNTSIEEVLGNLVLVIESQLDEMYCGILLLDDTSHVRESIIPNLPAPFASSLIGLSIGPKAGSSGTAMYLKEPVVVTDILQDPLWDDCRALAIPYGIRSSWSMPIMSHQGDVLGTFTTYCKNVCQPTSVETLLADMAIRIARIAIEHERSQTHIRHMTHHDVLTGLPNRALLEDRIKQAMLYADRYGRAVTLAFVGLDNFKLVNESLGHKKGDQLLKVMADRLTLAMRRTDTVIRVGGDEFVIVLFDQMETADVIMPTLQKIRDAVAEPVCIDGHDLHVTCSIGVSTYPSDGQDADILLKNADAAMHIAKELGRNNFQFYTTEMNTTINERLSMHAGLKTAIERDQFPLLYQPQLDLRTGKIIGVEALIRWQHPDLGLVSPAKFIPLAEETGLIVAIGDWVLRTACKQNKSWQDRGFPHITMSVNVSARQLAEKDLVQRVILALKDSGLEPHYLELELTESLIMKDVEQAILIMRELQALGIHLSIDDFGTGYSSLSALKHFPIVRLKIDQSFVRNIPNDQNDKAIASAMVALGHRLDLKVIAEGVEREDQITFLRDHNCDEMQGFLFSKPVAPKEVEALLQTQMDREAEGTN
ncbi:MAG: EAL domain-containing protein [Pseudomonadota bacterium]